MSLTGLVEEAVDGALIHAAGIFYASCRRWYGGFRHFRVSVTVLLKLYLNRYVGFLIFGNSE
jgi:hypothetical protein